MLSNAQVIWFQVGEHKNDWSMNAPFSILYLLSEDLISRNGPPQERGGCEIGRKELKWRKESRRSPQRIAKRPRKAGPLFHPLQLKKKERMRQSGHLAPTSRPCAAEALKSMATTLPWMPTITQMVYLGNGIGHLTASRDGTHQTPPPNSMILAGVFFFYQRKIWEPTTAPLCNRALCRL